VTRFLLTESNTGDGGCSYDILENGSSQSSTDYTKGLAARSYNITGYTDGCANYSSNQVELILVVDKIKPILVLSNNTAQINTSGLVGYWKFDEGVADAVRDSSGWENNGTIIGDNDEWAEGRFGYALDFDGTDYVNVTDSDSLDLDTTGEFTLMAWMKTSSISNFKQKMIFKQTQYHFSIDSNDELLLHIWDDSTTTTDLNLQEETWYHVVGTYSDSADKLKIYVNGSLVNEKDTVISLRSANNKPLLFGTTNLLVEYFNGTLDEVQIWDRALSVDEITELYESKVPYGTQTNFSGSESNTGDSDVFYDFFRNGTAVAIWHFDEGSENYTFDGTGNNNTGILENSTYGVPQWESGSDCKFGSCLEFDGEGDYVDVGNDESLDTLTESFTLEVWMKPNQESYYQRIIYRSGGGALDFALTGTPKIGLWVEYENGTASGWKLGDNTLSWGEWQHVVATFSKADGRFEFYLNGEDDGGADVDQSSLRDMTNNMYIGGAPGFDRYFNGTMDEVKIYPRVLSATEVLCRYGNNCSLYSLWNETETLPAGLHYYATRASGGENYTSSSLLIPLNISKVTPQTVLELNVSVAVQGDGVNITSYASDTVLETVIYTNYTGSLSNITPPTTGVNTNLTDTAGLFGYYQISANVSGNQNYTSNATLQTLYLSVTDGTPPTYTNNQSQLVAIYTSVGYSNFSITWSDNSGSLHDSYLENNFTGTLQNVSMSGTYPTYYYNSTPLAAGDYQYRFVANDSAGNANATEVRYFTISKADSTSEMTLTLDGDSTASQVRVYPNATDIQSSESNTGDTDCTYILLWNGSTISNGAITFPARSHNITYAVSGCTNYTNNRLERILTVSKGGVNIDMWLNGTLNGDNTVTYPSDINATCKINITLQNSFVMHRNGTSVGTQSGQRIEYNDDSN
jgi:hypothetical protein